MIKRRGQPSKYRRDFHNEDFIRLSRQGKNFLQIASEWEVDRHTIQNWGKKHSEFLAAIKKGRCFCEAWYLNLGQLAMVGQATLNGQKVKVDVGLYVWLTKNMFKWSDRVEAKVSDPTDPKDDPGKDYTDEELDAM